MVAQIVVGISDDYVLLFIYSAIGLAFLLFLFFRIWNRLEDKKSKPR